MKRIFLITMVLILFCSPAWAINYFIDPDNGNDSNAGTDGGGAGISAWKTIGRIGDAMGAELDGDDAVYLICDGTWTKGINNEWGGDDEIWISETITIGAYYMVGETETICNGTTQTCVINGDVNPVIDGVYTTTGLGGATPTPAVFRFITGSDDSVIQDLTLNNYHKAVHIKAIEAGTPLPPDDVIMQRLTIDHMSYEAIECESVDNVYSDSPNIQHVYGPIIQDCTVTRLQMAFTGGLGGWGVGISFLAVENGIIRRNIMDRVHGEGINIYKNSDNCLIEDNVVTRTASVALYVTSGCDNNIFQYNVAKQVVADTTWNPTGAGGRSAGGMGIGPEFESGSDASNNPPGCSASTGYSPFTEASGNIFRYNIISGFYEGGFHTSSRCSDGDNNSANPNLVYNNTFIDNKYNYWLYVNDENYIIFKNNLSIINDTTFNTGHIVPPNQGTYAGNVTFESNGWDTEETHPAWVDHAGDTDGVPDIADETPCTLGWADCADPGELLWTTITGNMAAQVAGSPFIDTAEDLGADYQFSLDPTSSWPSSVSTLAQGDHGSGWDNGAFIYVAAEDDPPANNDCSSAIAHYILDANVEDSTTNNNDLTAVASPTYSGGGVVLNGSTQYAHRANLSSDIATMSLFANFRFDAEFAHGHSDTICGEFDFLDERVFVLMIGDNLAAGDGDDVIRFHIGHTNGTNSAHIESATDLDHGTQYSVLATYDSVNDDVHVYIHNLSGTILNGASGETDAALLGAETQNIESTPFNLGCFLNNGSPEATAMFDGIIYEVAVYDSEKSQTDGQDFSKSEYADSSAISVQGMSKACSNLTAAGTMTWAIGWDREPYTEGGAWTIEATFDYPVAAQTMSYIGKWNDQSGWVQVGATTTWYKITYITPTSLYADTNVITHNDTAYAALGANEWDWVDWDGTTAPRLYVRLTDGSDPSDDVITPSPWETYVSIGTLAGWRQDSFGDAQISAAITLPTGVTIVDAQDEGAVIAGALTGLGTYPANTVANPGIFTICASGCDVTGINGQTQLNTDVWYYQENTTENLTITADQMVIQGSRNTLTGTVTFNIGSDCNVINCLNVSGAVTDNGTDNFVREYCPVFQEIGPKNYSPFF